MEKAEEVVVKGMHKLFTNLTQANIFVEVNIFNWLVFTGEIKEENDSEEEVQLKPVIKKKKSKSKPDMAIRRKQLKAKSKLISDQIKKRKQFKKKKPNKK